MSDIQEKIDQLDIFGKKGNLVLKRVALFICKFERWNTAIQVFDKATLQ
jgi:hypothetical protein